MMEVGADFSACCLHTLCAVDPHPLTSAADITEAELRERAERNCQLLLEKVSQLPRESNEDGTFVVLPKVPEIKFPRVRPVPSEKAKTRWEKFAEDRGITKRKRSRMVWDDLAQDWRPRWGYKSAAKNKQQIEEAIVELKPGQEFSDPLEKTRSEALLVKKKQKLRELRNKVEAKGGKVLPIGAAILGADAQDAKKGKEALSKLAQRTQVSTASMGRFPPKLRGDKHVKKSKRKALKSRRK